MSLASLSCMKFPLGLLGGVSLPNQKMKDVPAPDVSVSTTAMPRFSRPRHTGSQLHCLASCTRTNYSTIAELCATGCHKDMYIKRLQRSAWIERHMTYHTNSRGRNNACIRGAFFFSYILSFTTLRALRCCGGLHRVLARVWLALSLN